MNVKINTNEMKAMIRLMNKKSISPKMRASLIQKGLAANQYGEFKLTFLGEIEIHEGLREQRFVDYARETA